MVMVHSKTHARLGASAAASLLVCTMSIVIARSGGHHIAPAVPVGMDDDRMDVVLKSTEPDNQPADQVSAEIDPVLVLKSAGPSLAQ